MSDLISRQDAIDAIMGEPTDAHYPSWYAQRIKLLPSAKPEIIACGEGELSAEPKTGEWVDAEIQIESGCAMPIQVCNLCNTFYPLAHTGGGYHYCPNCGAKMQVGDSE